MNLDRLAELTERALDLEKEIRVIQAHAEEASKKEMKMLLKFELPVPLPSDKDGRVDIYDQYGFIRPEFIDGKNTPLQQPQNIFQALQGMMGKPSIPRKPHDQFEFMVDEKVILHVLGLALSNKMLEYRNVKDEIKTLVHGK